MKKVAVSQSVPVEREVLPGRLRMGIDVPPYTDPETVPHVRIPGHVPVYTLECYDKGITRWVFYRSGDVVDLVEEAHMDPRPMRLMEDGYQVMTLL